jgi:zinc transporter ZupT
MSNFDKQWRKIPTRYGLGLMGALIGYFLLMNATGFGHDYWLRALNALILFSIVRGAIKAYKDSSDADYYNDFFNFFKIGMRTALLGVAGFAVFVALYLDVIDPAFLVEVQTQEKISPYLTPVTAAGIVFIEGFGSAFICSYLVIQILKKSTVEKEVAPSDK